jgi:hypothetical protein|tara:strand:- start:256 stop:441 length:186 start_codon:yes stop_codon:yes gene_type:complete
MSNMTKEKGKQWDGKSRVSNETYRQNWNDIFKKEKTLHEQLMEGFDKEQYGTTEETDGTTD